VRHAHGEPGACRVRERGGGERLVERGGRGVSTRPKTCFGRELTAWSHWKREGQRGPRRVCKVFDAGWHLRARSTEDREKKTNARGCMLSLRDREERRLARCLGLGCCFMP
jgi:hypothetical protein